MPLADHELKALTEKAWQIRRSSLDVVAWAGGAHIGGALSCADILVLLYYKVLRIRPSEPKWPDRDRFILSKGHSGCIHAAVLADKGFFDGEMLKTFNHNYSAFGMHLNAHTVVGVDVSTGSLGHGLPISVGMGIGARHQHKDWRIYCLMGDGECNEGSVWEAAMAASHYKVANVTAFVDRNMLMLDGPTEKVMSLEPFAQKWEAFGWNTLVVDGHSFAALSAAVDQAHAETTRPTVIIAKTIKGKGVDFMENQVAWHYGGLNSDMLAKARASVDRAYGKA